MSGPPRPVPDLASILRCGWGIAGAIHPLETRWFTGKVLARCESGGGAWCLAGAPDVSRERIGAGALLQSRLIAGGCRVIPEIRPTLAGELVHGAGGRSWTLTGWVDGEPVHEQREWTAAMLEQLGRAVGELHRTGRELVAPGSVPGQAPDQYWTGDWSRFDDWARRRWRELLAVPEVRGSRQLSPLLEVIALGVDALQSLGPTGIRNLTITHGDLWTEHVLFGGGGRLAAIIDLDGLRVGDGHGDLAALLSDFADLEPDRCASVVRGYRRECVVTDADLAAIRATVVRQHLLTLLERIRRWRELPDRRDDLITPTAFWQRSLPAAVDLDPGRWTRRVTAREAWQR